MNNFLSASDRARRAEQVAPPVPPHAGGQGTGLLMWPQRLASGDALTTVAAGATAALQREHAARAAVAFLVRLHAGATPEQAAALPAPAPVPLFTARGPEPVPHTGLSRLRGQHVIGTAFKCMPPPAPVASSPQHHLLLLGGRCRRA